jgi:CPA1 family monovalent cation:H+ antiporter
VTAAVGVVSARLKIPPAILLVIVGLVLALAPGLPAVELVPELVLLLVLPPIIYWSAAAMSWREFRFNLRPIVLLAVGCVVFTTIAVAGASHWLLGFAWPMGFLLGAIVSPPDAVAPLSIARRMQLPRRILVVLEGEGLANDATALILYRFAVAAVSVGAFSFPQAVATFAAIVAGKIVWGIGVGWLMLRLRRWVNDPRIEITLSILTPFLAYWPPEQLGGSGVLATVTTGLYISWNGLRLISAATRLQGVFFWDFFIYLDEGMVFLITGLQARTLIVHISPYSISQLATSAAVVSAVVITARFAWIYPATYLPRWLFPAIRRRDPSPSWQVPFVQSVHRSPRHRLACGSARHPVYNCKRTAVPRSRSDSFPDIFRYPGDVGRSRIDAAFGNPRARSRARRESGAPCNLIEEQLTRRRAIEVVIARLDQLAVERDLSEDTTRPLRSRHRDRLRHIGEQSDGNDDHGKLAELQDEIELLLIAAERREINELYVIGKLKDEARRRIEREINLREAQLANERARE